MSHQFTTTVEFEGNEIELIVDFDYQPEEKRTYWHPGCPAEVEITSVKEHDAEIPDYIFNCISQRIADDAWDFIAKLKASYEEDRADYLFEQKRYA